MPLILGTNSIKDTGYNVDNSCRFNQPSSDYLNRTPSSAGNQKTYTVSCWYKRTNFGASEVIMSTTNGGSSFFSFGFVGSGTYADKFQFYWYDGTTDYGYHSAGLYRDTSAWYHIVLAIDTTQGTESNRAKVYINGVQETLTATYGAFPQNLDTYFNNTNVHYIGYNHDSSGALLNGYLSEVVNIDGQQLDPTSFGEFDEDSGIWKPIDVSGLTFGNNGFYLNFEDSSALGNDVSGNDNDFTVNNLTAIDQSTDTCTNNFATLNPLHFGSGSISNTALSEGNLKFVSTQGGSPYPYYFSTMAVSKGKWYVEFKYVSSDSGTAGIGNGVADSYSGNNAYDYSYYFDGRLYNNGSGESTGYASISDNNILGCALDLDNNKIYFHINGSYQASGNPTNGTGGKSITAPASNGTGVYHFEVGDSGANQPTIECNFGSPPYTISSGNTDGNGYGNFEYAVPSGYYSLNTKNLAEYG